MQKKNVNHFYSGASNRTSLYDLSIPNAWNNQLVIFIHGYMGYKDWGCWNLVSSYFNKKGFAFLKYNASHNGGTIEKPIDFSDLDSFSENNYMKEIEDFEAIMQMVEKKLNNDLAISVIGHSRGGAIALLQSDNRRIQRIATWAAISSIENRFPSGTELATWKKNGSYVRENGRTKQQMPHNYNQFENFLEHKKRLNVERYCRNSTTPTLIIHGEKDTSVTLQDGISIASWLDSNLEIIKNAQHTFNSSQPWNKDFMPKELIEVCELTSSFFNLPIDTRT